MSDSSAISPRPRHSAPRRLEDAALLEVEVAARSRPRGRSRRLSRDRVVARVLGRARASATRPVRGHPRGDRAGGMPASTARAARGRSAGGAHFPPSRSARPQRLLSSRSRLRCPPTRSGLPTPSPLSTGTPEFTGVHGEARSTARRSRVGVLGSSWRMSRDRVQASTTRFGSFGRPPGRRWKRSVSSMPTGRRRARSSAFPAPATTPPSTSRWSPTQGRRSTPTPAWRAGASSAGRRSRPRLQSGVPRGYSSVGRAPGSHPGGRQFEPG